MWKTWKNRWITVEIKGFQAKIVWKIGVTSVENFFRVGNQKLFVGIMSTKLFHGHRA